MQNTIYTPGDIAIQFKDFVKSIDEAEYLNALNFKSDNDLVDFVADDFIKGNKEKYLNYVGNILVNSNVNLDGEKVGAAISLMNNIKNYDSPAVQLEKFMNPPIEVLENEEILLNSNINTQIEKELEDFPADPILNNESQKEEFEKKINISMENEERLNKSEEQQAQQENIIPRRHGTHR